FLPSKVHEPQEARAVPAPLELGPIPVKETIWVLSPRVIVTPLAMDVSEKNVATSLSMFINGAAQSSTRRQTRAARDNGVHAQIARYLGGNCFVCRRLEACGKPADHSVDRVGQGRSSAA